MRKNGRNLGVISRKCIILCNSDLLHTSCRGGSRTSPLEIVYLGNGQDWALPLQKQREEYQMASKQTANYGLSQWEAGDQVLRADFNADNAKIDAALNELAQERICMGSFVGDGTNGRVVELPFTPKLVLLLGHYSSGTETLMGVVTADACRILWGVNSSQSMYETQYVKIGEKQLTFSLNTVCNSTGRTTYYVLFRD